MGNRPEWSLAMAERINSLSNEFRDVDMELRLLTHDPIAKDALERLAKVQTNLGILVQVLSGKIRETDF